MSRYEILDLMIRQAICEAVATALSWQGKGDIAYGPAPDAKEKAQDIVRWAEEQERIELMVGGNK